MQMNYIFEVPLQQQESGAVGGVRPVSHPHLIMPLACRHGARQGPERPSVIDVIDPYITLIHYPE